MPSCRFKEITAVQESFKEQIAHYRSEEGMTELANGFDPDSDGAISEEEFLDAFPGFLAFLNGGSPPASPAAGQSRSAPPADDGEKAAAAGAAASLGVDLEGATAAAAALPGSGGGGGGGGADSSPRGPSADAVVDTMRKQAEQEPLESPAAAASAEGQAALTLPEPEPEPEPEPQADAKSETEAEGEAASYFQRMWRGFKVRRSMNLASAAAELLKKQEDEYEARSQAAMTMQQGDGSSGEGSSSESESRSIAAQQRLTELRKELKSNHVRHHRASWFISTAKLQVQHDRVNQVEADVARRQVMMIRRATHEWYFSAAQVKAIVEAVPIGRAGHYHRVEALVALFARITDIEYVSFDRLLGHNGYDQDGNHMVRCCCTPSSFHAVALPGSCTAPPLPAAVRVLLLHCDAPCSALVLPCPLPCIAYIHSYPHRLIISSSSPHDIIIITSS